MVTVGSLVANSDAPGGWNAQTDPRGGVAAVVKKTSAAAEV